MMDNAFEWFRDPGGHLTASLGMPYNELFSTQEIRRLTFTRLQASKSQDLPLVQEEGQVCECSCPAADSLMGSWLVLGTKLIWSPALLMTAFLTSYSGLPLRYGGQVATPR